MDEERQEATEEITCSGGIALPPLAVMLASQESNDGE